MLLKVIKLIKTNKNRKYINEASLPDQIKMTKNQFEFDQKKLTTMNLNVGT